MNELLNQILENPEMIPDMIREYKGIIYPICKSLFGVFEDLVNNDHFFTTEAKFVKKQYDALLSAGFTYDQAMAIIIADKKSSSESLQRITNSLGKK